MPRGGGQTAPHSLSAPFMRNEGRDGIIFELAQVLQRGWVPKAGHRYVPVFSILPSPVFWPIAFDRTNGEGFSSGYTWHEEAQKLWEKIHLQN